MPDLRHVKPSDGRFTCPCCGYRTLSEAPGNYEICKVCSWEDDGAQLLDPAYRGGANAGSLMEHQTRFLSSFRGPERAGARDPEWRPAQESDLHWARTPRDLTEAEYKSLDAWYYWKREVT